MRASRTRSFNKRKGDTKFDTRWLFPFEALDRDGAATGARPRTGKPKTDPSWTPRGKSLASTC